MLVPTLRAPATTRIAMSADLRRSTCDMTTPLVAIALTTPRNERLIAESSYRVRLARCRTESFASDCRKRSTVKDVHWSYSPLQLLYTLHLDHDKVGLSGTN